MHAVFRWCPRSQTREPRCENSIKEVGSLGQMVARLRLFIRVLRRGCRIVPVDTLECGKCDYSSICKEGYFYAPGGNYRVIKK